jgi:hypothetical protein
MSILLTLGRRFNTHPLQLEKLIPCRGTKAACHQPASQLPRLEVSERWWEGGIDVLRLLHGIKAVNAFPDWESSVSGVIVYDNVKPEDTTQRVVRTRAQGMRAETRYACAGQRTRE